MKNKHATQIIQGKKYYWQIPTTKIAAVHSIANENHLSIAIAQILYTRGYHDEQSVRSFLFTSYQDDVANPTLLSGNEQAVARLTHAINTKEKILIFGDYDVDGITSTSLLLIALLPLGANINYFLPNRARDGYGLSSKIVKRAAHNGYKLIITVDNGISAHEAAQTAQDLAIDLIITDHHRPHNRLPLAHAIVNPNQPGCHYPHKELAGVGVIFKLLSLLYQRSNMRLPDKVYELLMLGTIADVVPLVTENRYWVQYGLSKVNKQRSYAMQVLAANSNLTRQQFNSLDIGFMIAPQLNALGRLDDPRDAVRFLISSNKNDVARIGKFLKKINEKRKLIDSQIYKEVETALLDGDINLETEPLIMAADHNWPAGVIGLVAGKLMHNYGRPTILFHLTKNGIAKGSCRSIASFNIFDALQENEDLLLSFGGHSMAAGLALKQKDIPKLKQRLDEKIYSTVAPEDLVPKLNLDAHLELGDMTKKFVSDLSMLEPFGSNNAQPTFLIQNITLQQQPRLLKDAHIKCSVYHQGTIKPVIFFNRPDLYQFLREYNEKPFHLAGHVIDNRWQGHTSIEIQGLDIAVP